MAETGARARGSGTGRATTTRSRAAEQLARLPHYLAQGADHYGFCGDVWTTKRMAVVITREFGVTNHPDHVRKRLRQLSWSPQQPIVHAIQRNDQAIYEWVEQRWPLITKSRR